MVIRSCIPPHAGFVISIAIVIKQNINIFNLVYLHAPMPQHPSVKVSNSDYMIDWIDVLHKFVLVFNLNRYSYKLTKVIMYKFFLRERKD